ncbi:MAG: tellurium resistance protein TerC [Elusimicrobia bacterium GWA2_69_24]|nr:MAG: tellurium resistance protein TerC [Elusimicrobia bacterium GWA2_69_24]HBL15541.1 tellurium resistance protein TerC [Elusimicrobiota bacterium]
MNGTTILWGIFWAIIAAALYLDLGVLNKRSHVVSLKEAALWCAAWMSLALLFDAGIWYRLGGGKALEFLTGYVLEYSLSVDNMFVFIVIFEYFGVPREYQSRVLHWGILGAVFMRFLFIFVGIALIHAFHWIIYVFGVILIYTGIKMMRQSEEKMDPAANPVLKLCKRFLPFSDRFAGQAFFSGGPGRWVATPLFATLLVVEVSDVVFALDSIPAVLAITTDTLIVYTSNVFAILGLRSLFFLLAGIMGLFRFLKVGISVILCFVGAKMTLADLVHVPIGASLSIVVGVLALSILFSVFVPQRAKA